MTPVTTLAPGARVTQTVSPIPTPRSGELLAPMEGRRLPRTFKLAPELRTPVTRITALTTVTTPGCRSLAESHTRHGPTIRTAPGIILTVLSTNSISTARVCRCADDKRLGRENCWQSAPREGSRLCHMGRRAPEMHDRITS